MGLDMYLEKMPRYKNTRIEDVNHVTDYFYWLNFLHKHPNEKLSFEEYVSLDMQLDQDILEHYSHLVTTSFSPADKARVNPWYSITEEIGYWRKANAIHEWFVKNVQDGEDDCQYHREVEKEDIEALLETCEKVAEGFVSEGKNEYGDDAYTVDSDLAREYLPCQEGFFFGGTVYDSYVYSDINGKSVELLETPKAVCTTT